MSFFIDWQTTLECIIIALVFACFLSLVCLKPVGILQSLGYSDKKLLKWAGKKSNLVQARLVLLFMTGGLSYAVIALCFSFAGKWAAVIGMAGYVVFFAVYFFADASAALKVDIKFTPRLKRLYITQFIVFAVLSYFAAALGNFLAAVIGDEVFTSLRYVFLSLLPLTGLIAVCLANLITLIWEKPIAAHYIKTAKEALASSGVKVIGITGSYGKTSVKQILAHILSQKYRVVATPSSFNTPLGIAKSANDEDMTKADIFIAEMGARQKGDIAELCRLCPPDYSVITGICPQHLESFKTQENIVSAKAEIIPATKQKCLVAEECFGYFKDIPGAICVSGCVSDVVSDSGGTAFTLTLGGESRRVATKLLGRHSAYNIGLCAALAYELGLTADEIASAIPAVPYVEHRLQLIKSGGINIIDDGYNANVAGVKAAVEVLKTFPGKKTAVTPGIVELGVLEERENNALGEQLVGLDNIILVGETLVKAVYSGYIKAGGDEKKVVFVPSLAEAQNVLKTTLQKGDTVLFLNDLPARYMS